MNRKRKIGILLILIGVGVPIVLYFFQEDGEIRLGKSIIKEVERNLTPEEIEFVKLEKNLQEKLRKMKISEKERGEEEQFEKYMKSKGAVKKEDYMKKEKWTIRTEAKRIMPYKYTIGIGLIFILVGIGMFIFSFPLKAVKKR